jgi:hypothetical protein
VRLDERATGKILYRCPGTALTLVREERSRPGCTCCRLTWNCSGRAAPGAEFQYRWADWRRVASHLGKNMNLRNITVFLLHHGSRASLMATLLLGGTGCDKTCSPPARTMYSCEAIASGSTGCLGGPPSASSAGAPAVDPDRISPVGCVAQLPFCVPAYSSDVQTCSCQDLGSPDGGTAPGWVCPK